MSMINYGNFFKSKTYYGLIKLIVEHRTNVNPLGEEWYNALIDHLKVRVIPDSVRVLIESAISDDLETLKISPTIQMILQKDVEELNIPQPEQKVKSEPLSNLNSGKVSENGGDIIIQIKKDEIIKAGNSIKGIGLLICTQFLITVIFLFLVMDQKDFEVIKNYYGLFAVISFFITLIVILQFIIAGDALKGSVKNN